MAQPTIAYTLAGAAGGNNNSGTSRTLASYVHPGGLVVVGLGSGYYNDLGAASVSVGGTALTHIVTDDHSATSCRGEFWGGDVAAGTHTITVTMNDGYTHLVIAGRSIAGALFADIGTPVTAEGSSTAPSVVCNTGATGDLIIDLVVERRLSNDTDTVVLGAGGTNRAQDSNTSVAGLSAQSHGAEVGTSHADGAASVTMDWTCLSNPWVVLSVPISESAAGTVVPVFMNLQRQYRR